MEELSATCQGHGWLGARHVDALTHIITSVAGNARPARVERGENVFKSIAIKGQARGDSNPKPLPRQPSNDRKDNYLDKI